MRVFQVCPLKRRLPRAAAGIRTLWCLLPPRTHLPLCHALVALVWHAPLRDPVAQDLTSAVSSEFVGHRLALALLMPGVRLADDVEVAVVSLARFPAHNLHGPASSALCHREDTGLEKPTLQCSHRFFTELCTFMPRTCCTIVCTAVLDVVSARPTRGREKSAVVRARVCVFVIVGAVAARARGTVRVRAPKERARERADMALVGNCVRWGSRCRDSLSSGGFSSSGCGCRKGAGCRVEMGRRRAVTWGSCSPRPHRKRASPRHTQRKGQSC